MTAMPGTSTPTQLARVVQTALSYAGAGPSNYYIRHQFGIFLYLAATNNKVWKTISTYHPTLAQMISNVQTLLDPNKYPAKWKLMGLFLWDDAAR